MGTTECCSIIHGPGFCYRGIIHVAAACHIVVMKH